METGLAAQIKVHIQEALEVRVIMMAPICLAEEVVVMQARLEMVPMEAMGMVGLLARQQQIVELVEAVLAVAQALFRVVMVVQAIYQSPGKYHLYFRISLECYSPTPSNYTMPSQEPHPIQVCV
jgi:hypothetical protein